jgi:hypothetical protein
MVETGETAELAHSIWINSICVGLNAQLDWRVRVNIFLSPL